MADRLRVLVTGHSILHPRQAGLWRALADRGHVVHAVGPQEWGGDAFPKEQYASPSGGAYHAHPSPGTGANFLAWRPHGLGPLLKVLGRVDVHYVVQEPWALLPRDVLQRAGARGEPVALFSWENRDDLPDAWGPQYLARERETLEHASLRLAVGGSRLAAERLKRRGARAVAVCPQTGVDTVRFQPRAEAEKETFALYAGRADPAKGLDLLERACKALNVPLLCNTLPGPWRPRLGWARQRAAGPWPSLARVYQAAEVHVSHPLSSFDGYKEQYGYAYAEAMSSALPSITSTNGSIPDAFAGSPMLMVPEGDEEVFKDHLNALVTSPSTRKQLGAAGRAWVVGNLSLSVIAERLEGHFKAMLDAPPSPSTAQEG